MPPADAVITLWLADRPRRDLGAAGLCEVAELEMAARPSSIRLSRHGFAFDADGYRAFLAEQQWRCAAAPAPWPSSPAAVRATSSPPRSSRRWNPASETAGQGGAQPLARGAAVARLLHPGRAAPRRLARGARPLTAVGAAPRSAARWPTRCCATATTPSSCRPTATRCSPMSTPTGASGPTTCRSSGPRTGRLASRHPNAQNLAPETKPFVRPPPGRVLVHADLSQAELRWMAQVSGDIRAAGRAAPTAGDVHVATASRMFGDDVARLRRDRSRPGTRELRARAKAINFGILYGLGARLAGPHA